uniref:Uncharacterized protein n=1 Tax=Pseudomonas fluorescens (strain SBW25) TaxID=216595 RepID=A4V7Q3_PSEFS|nr:hypothetical protein pQBR0143 [Pseudomonas fluorescens SBW25]
MPLQTGNLHITKFPKVYAKTDLKRNIIARDICSLGRTSYHLQNPNSPGIAGPEPTHHPDQPLFFSFLCLASPGPFLSASPPSFPVRRAPGPAG